MGGDGKQDKAHVVCVPYPAQGHINPMLKLAKILNSKGFHITFFHTQHNHSCILKTRGPDALQGTSSFRFGTYPDGLPPSTEPRDMGDIARSFATVCLEPFTQILSKLNDPSSGSPPVTLIISDVIVPFTLEAARLIGDCPVVMFSPYSACTLLAYTQFDPLLDHGFLPLKDGSLNTQPELVPSSIQGIRLKDLPKHSNGTTAEAELNNPVYADMKHFVARFCGSPLIVNTFRALEQDILKDLSNVVSAPIYTLGPLHNHSINVLEHNDENRLVECDLWKDDSNCLQWLDSREPNSVLYVSFGTSCFLSEEQFLEFAWGLANSNHHFLWIVRPDIITKGSGSGSGSGLGLLPPEFLKQVTGRGMVARWSPQEKVLNHPAVKAYLMHGGWNSILESITSGVPLVCWTYAGDQMTNSWYACTKLGIGTELSGVDEIVDKGVVEKKIKEVMEGERGEELKRKVMETKILAQDATFSSSNGSSILECDQFIDYVLSLKHYDE